jgi:LPXTG-motif cell wall-anchored protein
MTTMKWMVLVGVALVILILAFVMRRRSRRSGGVVAVHTDHKAKR